MNDPIIIPTIVATRWREAIANPSIPRWRSLTQMISSMVINASLHTPGAPLVDDLRTLAHVAHAHQLELQPRMLEEACAA